MSIEAAITSIRKYQAGRTALSAQSPLPADYDDQAVVLHNTLMSELKAAGYSNVPVALSAIQSVYPITCGDCHKCCAEYWPDCGSWNGIGCKADKTPMDCMILCRDCWDAIERNWPEAG